MKNNDTNNHLTNIMMYMPTKYPIGMLNTNL